MAEENIGVETVDEVVKTAAVKEVEVEEAELSMGELSSTAKA